MKFFLKTPSQTVGVMLLVLVTLIWGTTFPGVKIVTKSLTPAELVAARFLISGLFFLPFLKGSSLKLWRDAIPLGALLFVTFFTQAIGIQSISSGRAAFITGLNVIFVPLALPFLGKPVPKIAFLAAFLALAGIGIMSVDAQTLKFSLGDLWTLGCAISYAVYILLLDHVSSRHSSLQLSQPKCWWLGFWRACGRYQAYSSMVFPKLCSARVCCPCFTLV